MLCNYTILLIIIQVFKHTNEVGFSAGWSKGLRYQLTGVSGNVNHCGLLPWHQMGGDHSGWHGHTPQWAVAQGSHPHPHDPCQGMPQQGQRAWAHWMLGGCLEKTVRQDQPNKSDTHSSVARQMFDYAIGVKRSPGDFWQILVVRWNSIIHDVIAHISTEANSFYIFRRSSRSLISTASGLTTITNIKLCHWLHPLMHLTRTPVTADDAVYGHKKDAFPLRAIFALKKTRASAGFHPRFNLASENRAS